MPKRTNEFQEVVDHINRLSLPKGAKVTTSAMISPALGSPPREIDILIEFNSGLHGIFKIAIEAKDHKRPISVQQIEEYIGKYNTGGGLLVNKVIIVAKSFTKTARIRAAAVGFNLQTLQELDLKLGAYFDSEETKKRPPSKKGAKVIGSRPPQKLALQIFDAKGEVLPSTSVIFALGSRLCLGSAEKWSRLFYTKGLQQHVSQQVAKFAGEMVSVMIEVTFSNHYTISGGKKTKLGRARLFPPATMVFPSMSAKQFEIKTDTGEVKQFVVETGFGANSKLTISYEKDESEYPKAIYVDHKGVTGPEKPKTRFVRIDSKI